MALAALASDHHCLTAVPIAHRGLHDRVAGRVENSLSAARAAMAGGFAIECDVQLSVDGEAMVFHDFTLDRLTRESGLVRSRSAAKLSTITLGESRDSIPTLSQLLALIGGSVPLVCEIKSAFDGDTRAADRVAHLIEDYAGPIAVKSFDPAVITHLRRSHQGKQRPLGIIAEASYGDPEWDHLSTAQKRDLAALGHFVETRPDFLSYAVDDLPHAATTLFRAGIGGPVMTWTVRTRVQRERAARWADQIVFEGFLPETQAAPDDMSHAAALV